MNNKSWIERFAENIGEFLGKFAIPFTTPFFAIYNCYKLMKGVESWYLKLIIFSISAIYVIMSLCVAIYVVFKK